MRTRKFAFTLVEIMIVVVIIGILAGMAIPRFMRVRRTSQDKTILNNLRQLSNAAQQYFLEPQHDGALSVATVDLVGTATDKYIKFVTPVRSETYPTLINAASTQIEAGGVNFYP